jgi:hypothetical protein
LLEAFILWPEAARPTPSPSSMSLAHPSQRGRPHHCLIRLLKSHSLQVRSREERVFYRNHHPCQPLTPTQHRSAPCRARHYLPSTCSRQALSKYPYLQALLAPDSGSNQGNCFPFLRASSTISLHP